MHDGRDERLANVNVYYRAQQCDVQNVKLAAQKHNNDVK